MVGRSQQKERTPTEESSFPEHTTGVWRSGPIRRYSTFFGGLVGIICAVAKLDSGRRTKPSDARISQLVRSLQKIDENTKSIANQLDTEATTSMARLRVGIRSVLLSDQVSVLGRASAGYWERDHMRPVVRSHWVGPEAGS